MFKLLNVENKVELELSVEGYQFPGSQNDNWCNIGVSVKQGNDIFKVVDPALETTDLTRILDWFKCLDERKLPRYASLSFTEPCLEFEFLACKSSSVRISIDLSREMKPDFELKQFGLPPSKWKVVFELEANDFNEIISGVTAAMLSYPVRGKS